MPTENVATAAKRGNSTMNFLQAKTYMRNHKDEHFAWVSFAKKSVTYTINGQVYQSIRCPEMSDECFMDFAAMKTGFLSDRGWTIFGSLGGHNREEVDTAFNGRAWCCVTPVELTADGKAKLEVARANRP